MTKLSSQLSSVTRLGLDLAKHVFQVHAVDAEGREIGNYGGNYELRWELRITVPGNYQEITVPVY